jgi:hypothetical protein
MVQRQAGFLALKSSEDFIETAGQHNTCSQKIDKKNSGVRFISGNSEESIWFFPSNFPD